MSRVIPSQIVRLIDQYFDFAARQQQGPLPGSGSQPALDRGHSMKVRAIHDLCTRLDDALAPRGDDFVLFSTALSEIGAKLDLWQGGDKNATLLSSDWIGLDRS